MKNLLFAIAALITIKGYGQRIITAPTIDSTYTIPVNKGKLIRRIYALDLKGAGLTNPMTTTGDIIYASSGSTPARLPIGANGTVLGVTGGALGYVTVSASGTVDATPTASSTNPVQSGGVFTALSAKAPTSNPTLTNATLSGFPSLAILKITRTTKADVAYTLSGSDYLVAYTSLTATRAVTLPAASSCPNTHFIIKDESGSASGTIKITIIGTVDGVANPDAVTTAYGKYRFYSNGTSYFTE